MTGPWQLESAVQSMWAICCAAQARVCVRHVHMVLQAWRSSYLHCLVSSQCASGRDLSPANMPGNAFVYGTLMADEVLKLLIKRVPVMKPAVLHGYQRHKVKNQVFPAIVPSSSVSKVQGQVLIDLTDNELQVLDVYESVEYYRQTVEPELEDGSKVQADVYVWKDEFRNQLEASDWDYAAFKAEHLAHYLDMTEEFVQQEIDGNYPLP